MTNLIPPSKKTDNKGMCLKKRLYIVSTNLMGFYALQFCVLIVCVLLSSCHFDYGEDDEYKSTLPDITMEQLEYVRVKNGNLVARMEAEIGDRYEERHVMELKNFNFEQYDVSSGDVDALGTGGKAVVELDTGNVQMSEDININVESEDFDITTEKFDWKDKSKTLTGPTNSPVNIERSDGTTMRGNGFSADLRTKTWIFSSQVDGVYVFEDEEDEAGVHEEKTVTVSSAAESVKSADGEVSKGTSKY
ncbi:MAG: hypothetical protein Ta2B_19270 [Termitinemataceae bacterium]|nr:MAG: hypothetical protein Ta2B_19270 [Termitinemataceae bacterium]